MPSLRTRLVVGALAAASFVLFAWLALARLQTVHHRTFDLALYTRIAWGLSHGDLWSPVLNSHVLGAHLSPVLLPLGLLGRLFGTAQVLLVAQAAAVAACVFPMAALGARHLGGRGALLGALAFLLYPNLGHVASYEFHPGSLALLPLSYALVALDAGRLRRLVVCVGLMLLCREDLALTGLVLGLSFYALHRTPRALVLCAACLAYGALALWIVSAYAPREDSLSLHFGPWGGSPFGIVSALWNTPSRVLQHFSEPERLLYLPRVLLPLAFMPLRAPWVLAVAMPALAINLISVFGTSLEQYSHYLSAAVPPLVAAGVIGLGKTRGRAPVALVLACASVSHLAWSGLPWARDFDAQAFRADARTLSAARVLSAIPAEASVQAPDMLLPHLAERKVVRRGPPPDVEARFVVLDLSHRQRFAQQESLLRTLEEPLARRYLARRDHALVVYAEPFALLERGRAPHTSPISASYRVPKPPHATQAQRLSRCLSLLDAALRGDVLNLTFIAHGPCPEDLALRLGEGERPKRVDLLFDGALSPAHLGAGEVLRSRHVLDAEERALAQRNALRVGLLRSSGARVEPDDPTSIPVIVR